MLQTADVQASKETLILKRKSIQDQVAEEQRVIHAELEQLVTTTLIIAHASSEMLMKQQEEQTAKKENVLGEVIILSGR